MLKVVSRARRALVYFMLHSLLVVLVLTDLSHRHARKTLAALEIQVRAYEGTTCRRPLPVGRFEIADGGYAQWKCEKIAVRERICGESSGA